MSRSLADFSDDELLQELSSRVRAESLKKTRNSNLIYALFDAAFDSLESTARSLVSAFELVARRSAGKIEKIAVRLRQKLSDNNDL